MNKKLLNIVLIVVAIAIIALAITPALFNKHKTAGDKPVVKIGLVYPLSGNSAMFGSTATITTKQFFKEFNKQPRKYTYEVLFEDGQFKSATSVLQARRLMDMEKVDVLVVFGTSFALPIAPIVEDKNVILFSYGSDPTAMIKYKNAMAITGDPDQKGPIMLDLLRKKNIKTIDIVVANMEAPQNWLDALQKTLQGQSDVSIKNIYTLNPDEREFKMLLAKIKQDKPDAVVSILQPLSNIFLRQYKMANVSIPLIGVDLYTFLDEKSLAEGAWQVSSPEGDTAFRQRLLAEIGSDTTYFSEYLDTILQLITHGFETAGTTDKEQIMQHIIQEAGNLDTALGRLTATPEGLFKAPFVIRKIEGGKLVPVE